MNPTLPTTPVRGRLRRLGFAGAAGVLAATGLAVPTAQATPGTGASELPDNCRLVYHSTTFVECAVTDSGEVSLDGLVPAGLAPRDGTSVVLTARGGAGATLSGNAEGRSGGAGGVARTSVPAADVDGLHVYVGQDAPRGSREGGSATIVSDVPLEDVTSIEDTYLVAGGGGAQGARMKCFTRNHIDFYGGAGEGGAGGVVDANHDADGLAASAAGGAGGQGDTVRCSGKSIGHSGTGGDRGVAGTNRGDARSDGLDGVGGKGGVNGWAGGVAAGHEAGRGGITGVYAMGGGGWGGGGGGERNGGAGGGGSYASAASEWVDVPRSHPATASVTIAWPL